MNIRDEIEKLVPHQMSDEYETSYRQRVIDALSEGAVILYGKADDPYYFKLQRWGTDDVFSICLKPQPDEPMVQLLNAEIEQLRIDLDNKITSLLQSAAAILEMDNDC